MLVAVGALALALVLVIAAVVIGRESSRLSAEPPRPVFDLDEAVGWVADRVPFEVAAVLSHDDVRRILIWNLEYLRSKGVAGDGAAPPLAGDPLPVVVEGDETAEWVVGQARASGLDYTLEQVAIVLDAQMAYLDAIGAVAPAEPGDGPQG